MSSTPTDAVDLRRGGNSMREMSSGAGVTPATGSRSRIAVAVRSVRAVPQRIEGTAIGTGILAAERAGGDREAAALAGHPPVIPSGSEGSWLRFRKRDGKVPRVRSG
jgi:hypothetical protein